METRFNLTLILREGMCEFNLFLQFLGLPLPQATSDQPEIFRLLI